MPSKVVRNPEPLTRKQRHHIRRDQEQTRWVWIVTAVILVLVAAVIGFGYYSTYYLQVNNPAANRVRRKDHYRPGAKRSSLGTDAVDRHLQPAQPGRHQPARSPIQCVLLRKPPRLKPTCPIKRQIGDGALQFLIEVKIAEHEAAARGITVSDAEVQDQVDAILGYIPEATLTAMPSPTNTVPFTPTPTWTITPSPTLGGPTFTPTSTITPTPTITPTFAITGTVTPSLTPTITSTPTLIPTATPFTQAEFQKYYTLYLSNVHRMTMMQETDFRARVRAELLVEKVKAAVEAELPRNVDQVHLAQIVVADQATAASVRARIVAGKSFSSVAKEVSLDAASKANGGDLGWIAQGNPPSAMEKIAFGMNFGEISQPIQTGATTWVIIQLLDKGSRPMAADKYASQQLAYYQQWLQNAETATGVVVKKGIPTDLIPTDPAI